VNKVSKWWGGLSTQKKYVIKAIVSVLLWLFAITFFVVNKSSFYGIDNDGNPSMLKKKVLIYFACFMVYTVCIFLKNPLKRTGNRILNIHIMEWFPFVCMIMVETALDGNIFTMKFRNLILNLLMYMVVLYLIYAISASVKASVIGLSIFTALFGITNVYLMEFRQIPLLATDFTDLKAAANVAGGFTFDLSADVILLICFVVAVIVIAMKLEEQKPGKKYRIAIGIVYICFFAGMLNLTVFTTKLNDMGVKINTFRPSKSYRGNGGMLTFARSIRYLIIDKPDGYSDDKAAQIASNYESDSVGDEGERPNVIVVMNESFSDLQSVGQFETNEEVLPFYNSLKENTVKGYAYVSSFGGKTANSEFEFQTGDTKAFLPDGSTPYQLYIKEYLPTLTGNLKIDNYSGMLAMHPFNASGYNRENVYQLFGFSDFISKEDIDMSTVKLVRSYVSDESHVDRIIEEYEKSRQESDEPFYMFNVTMQNHSPYGTSYDNLPDTIQITTPECKDDDAQRYLNLVHLSDAAAKKLVEYFEQVDEPTVVVMFGDHQPGLSDSFYESIMGIHPDQLTGEESMERFKVPFFIWANYDIEEKYVEKTSLNYLQSMMLDVAGMKKTGYNKYLLDLMEDIPAMNAAGYFASDGMYYSISDETSPYYDKLVEYNVLEYNHLFGKNRVDEFFELKDEEE
jgi:phosphoglycerol transferase MdoB-like AlkP superfamily enzyme